MFHWSPCEDGKKAAGHSSECNVEAEKSHLYFLVEKDWLHCLMIEIS